MTSDSTPVIYELTLQVDDPVFFSTQEMNKRITTSEYLHNYALTYALLHAAGRADLLTDYSRQYERTTQEPQYKADLRPLPFYVFPATPQAVGFTSEVVNTTSEQFEEVVTPERGKRYFSAHEIQRIAVGSTFRTFLIAENEADAVLTSPIRLGKFRGKVSVEPTRHTPENRNVDTQLLSTALNTVDVPDDFSTRISNISMTKMRPTPLITETNYTGPAYVTEDIILPQDAHYFKTQT